MLENKPAFSMAYHSQTDVLGERMIHTMEDIIIIFYEYEIDYKDLEGYTHQWVTLLPEFQLAYNTSNHSTTENSSSAVEKGWDPLIPVDHLKKDILTIHPTAKDPHDMWKRSCDIASR
ncbi:hypothetical protein O181_017274 [Austropuccinia psidii MF-1]|uniref:Integrase catalytic domain-containing protein n=1 Tax=Austropuccinia psidii MF-1 TaxID=1389203 RepID=A0A9Q3C5F4_9BASI|nr:hypothetical protein [Austropuccinia psidii MF-1]